VNADPHRVGKAAEIPVCATLLDVERAPRVDPDARA
jgi:hypothetical protein